MRLGLNLRVLWIVPFYDKSEVPDYRLQYLINSYVFGKVMGGMYLYLEGLVIIMRERGLRAYMLHQTHAI